MQRKRATGTNTLALIRQWSMDGADGDLDAHFASPVDIHALVSERGEEPSIEVPSPAPAPLLLKLAGEDDWRPLFVEVPNPA